MNITDFLEARIEEDESAAKDAYDHDRWQSEVDGNGDTWVTAVDRADQHWRVAMVNAVPAQHIVSHDPARVLAECAAKRVIIELARKATEAEQEFDNYEWQGTVERTEPWTGDAILLALASVYKDHPDYQQEWA